MVHAGVDRSLHKEVTHCLNSGTDRSFGEISEPKDELRRSGALLDRFVLIPYMPIERA